MERREALLGMTAVAGWIAGCVESENESAAEQPTGSSGSAGNTESEEDDPSSDSPDQDGSRPESKGPVRGESEVDLSVHVVEDDDDVEYLPEEESVRIVTARQGDEAVEYQTMEWTSWAPIQCGDAAAERVLGHVADRLDSSVSASAADGAVTVEIWTMVDRDGEVTQTPAVDFERLVSVTPQSVSATYEFAGRQESCDLPVYAEHSVGYLD